MQLNYTTLFFCDLVTGGVYAGVMLLLALRYPHLRTQKWFSIAIVLGLCRDSLLSMLGHAPLPITLLLPSLCNVWYFYCIFRGFQAAVLGEPSVSRYGRIILLAESLLFAILFLAGFRYTFLLGVGPVLVLSVLSIRILARNRRPEIRTACIAAIAVLGIELAIVAIRAPFMLVRFDNHRIHGVLPGQHEPFWLFSMAALMLVSACFFVVFLCFFERELHEELLRETRTDALTGATNTRALEEIAARELSRAHRGAFPPAVIAFDLDHFKQINDRHGHAAGDEILRRLVAQLRGELRAGDTLARTGGEEFIVLLPRTGIAAAERIAQRLRSAVQRLVIRYDDRRVNISISLGVCEYRGEEDTWFDLLGRCDKALYEAKRAGRNRVVVAAAPPTLLTRPTTHPIPTLSEPASRPALHCQAPQM